MFLRKVAPPIINEDKKVEFGGKIFMRSVSKTVEQDYVLGLSGEWEEPSAQEIFNVKPPRHQPYAGINQHALGFKINRARGGKLLSREGSLA